MVLVCKHHTVFPSLENSLACWKINHIYEVIGADCSQWLLMKRKLAVCLSACNKLFVFCSILS